MSQPAHAPTRHLLEALLLAVAFAAAHTQSPLYYSNQNQYLLHGAALAHDGHLANDWLATTRDPTPLFSALVAATYATAGPWLLQPAYFALLMGYVLAARWLVAAVPGVPDTRAARVAFAALFTAAHAAILRWASVQLTGVDYPWYLQAGLAAQYLLGPGIQPSAFGVLLLVAVAAFAHGRAVLAAALLALAVACHGTYVLHSALLTLGFMTALARRGEWRKAAVVGAVALAVVSPAVIYNVREFSAEPYTADRAYRILAEVRIPHHSVPSRWFDAVAGAQLAWIGAGLFLLRRTPLFTPLAVAAAGCVLLTALQLATGGHALALMFPWRISVLLVPVATAVVIAKALAWRSWPSPLAGEGGGASPTGEGARPDGSDVSLLTRSLRSLPSPARGEGEQKTWGERLAGAVLLALVAGGAAVTACGLGYRTVDEHELYDHVRATAGPDDVYLLPVQFPAVGTGRGAVSNTFAPPPRAKPGTNQIPVDLQRFRLATGACIYVDFKSVPYAPVEVLEWHRRMTLASELTANGTWDAPGRRDELTREGITHVVAPRTKPLAAGYLEESYRDDAYFVYKVR